MAFCKQSATQGNLDSTKQAQQGIQGFTSLRAKITVTEQGRRKEL
jgi:hypothetical protein